MRLLGSDQTGRCCTRRMPIPWGEHLELARVVEATGELDVGAAAVAMAGTIHLLQRDLLLASWEPQTFNVTATTLRSFTRSC